MTFKVRLPTAVATWLVLTSLAGLTGCTASVPGGSALWLAWPALLLVAGLACALGWLLGRQRGQADLRTAREALRGAQALHTQWRWQTDAAHRLRSWCAPGAPEALACALFDNAPDGVLGERLRAALPFGGLRVRQDAALEGHHSWELRGVPQHDDQGRFAGFLGTARPTDDDDALRLAAAALTPALDLNALPALLVRPTQGGWQVQQINAAAQAVWPQVAAGNALNDMHGQLPAAVLAAMVADDGTTVAHETMGWRLTPLGTATAGQRPWLLGRVAEPVPGAQAQAHEADNFSFTLSHDLRAPIRVVEGFTRIVKEDYGRHLDRVGNDHLDRVLGAVARMNLMIDAMLALARLSQQPLARQRVNLTQLATYVVDDLRRGAPERNAEIDIATGLAAWGDPTLLRLVLENLLGNAWKYSARTERTQISLCTVTQGDRTAFMVRDNGAGFDMRSAERLFGLFQRLHSASDFTGHGVGLASVRRIVQRHGGEIWAEAEPGRGATFYFTLPG